MCSSFGGCPGGDVGEGTVVSLLRDQGVTMLDDAGGEGRVDWEGRRSRRERRAGSVRSHSRSFLFRSSGSCAFALF